MSRGEWRLTVVFSLPSSCLNSIFSAAFFYFAGVYLEFKVQYSEYVCGKKSLREICPYVLVDGDLVLCCDVIMPLSRSKQKDGER